MSGIPNNFCNNFNSIFFGNGETAAKTVKLKKNGKTEKFYTTSLDRHNKSNIYYKFLAKVVHTDDFNRKKVLTNIATHLEQNSSTIGGKITAENYEDFNRQLTDMATALATVKPGQQDQDLTGLVERIATSLDKLKPHQVQHPESFQNGFPPVSPHRIQQSEQVNIEEDPDYKAIEKKLNQKDPLGKSDLKFIDSSLSAILKKLQHKKSVPNEVIILLEKYLNRVAPQNSQAGLAEWISSLDNQIAKAKEIAELIQQNSSPLYKHPAADPWNRKIEYLTNLKKDLLEISQKNTDEAAKQMVKSLGCIALNPEITQKIEKVRSSVGKEDHPTFTELSQLATDKQKEAKKAFKAADHKVHLSSQAEQNLLEESKSLAVELTNNIKDLKTPAEHDHETGKAVTEQTLTELNYKIKENENELKRCDKEIKEAQNGIFIISSKEKVLTDLTLKKHTLELDLARLQHRKVSYESKLEIQRFIEEIKPQIQTIENLAKKENVSQEELETLKWATEKLKEKCQALQEKLEISKNESSKKIAQFNVARSYLEQYIPLIINEEQKKALSTSITSNKGSISREGYNIILSQKDLNDKIIEKATEIETCYASRIDASTQTNSLVIDRLAKANELSSANLTKYEIDEVLKLIKNKAGMLAKSFERSNPLILNYFIAFAIDAQAREIPEEQWANKIIERLELEVVHIPEDIKVTLAAQINKTLKTMRPIFHDEEGDHPELDREDKELLEILEQLLDEAPDQEGVSSPNRSVTNSPDLLSVFSPLYQAIAKSVEPNNQVVTPSQVPASFEYKVSQDVGGHGGTKKVKIEYNGKTYPLFLKPKDPVETRGYEAIKKSDSRTDADVPRLEEFMPVTYGTVTIGGREYLIMEDICEGNHPLFDAKLSACIPGTDLNPIANQDEFRATRATTKNPLDYGRMRLEALSSPGYMIYVPIKALRFFNFHRSKQMLTEKLRNHDIGKLQQLVKDLTRLKEAMDASDIAFIGASVFFLNDGFKLIDPAHLQINPSQQQDYQGLGSLYYGTEQQYNLQRQSNQLSIDALIRDINEMIAKLSPNEESLGSRET
ncbi:MAG: hypothetical protein JSR93_07560 [Verrucomicrobia bacterium]|nr:hypothetical protein [Verrucomicrobiota bacterium]